jgi:hypothetical protein
MVVLSYPTNLRLAPMSTNHSEIVALYEAACECAWLPHVNVLVLYEAACKYAWLMANHI